MILLFDFDTYISITEWNFNPIALSLEFLLIATLKKTGQMMIKISANDFSKRKRKRFIIIR